MSAGNVSFMAKSFYTAALNVADSTTIPIYSDLSMCSVSNCNEVSRISKSVLASHATLGTMQELLNYAALRHCGLEDVDVGSNSLNPASLETFERLMKRKSAISDIGFASYRRTFQNLLNGHSLTNRKYKCRFTIENINRAMEFLRSSLSPKAGDERSMWIGARIFEKLLYSIDNLIHVKLCLKCIDPTVLKCIGLECLFSVNLSDA